MSELPFTRPIIGARVEKLPSATVPARSIIVGRHVQLEPLSADRHAAELYAASHGSEQALAIWNYLPVGPWPSLEAYTSALRQQSSAFDRIFYALRPTEGGPVAGQASYLDIHPQDGVIEIGSIWFGSTLRRTRAATEALYLLIRYAMDDLGYRRMQWRCKCRECQFTQRRAAARLPLRGHLLSPHDLQGEESRHGLVLHPRRGMARAARDLRGVAAAGELRCARHGEGLFVCDDGAPRRRARGGRWRASGVIE
jgi:RimJ/RimL family protein N-acetyltransferase